MLTTEVKLANTRSTLIGMMSTMKVERDHPAELVVTHLKQDKNILLQGSKTGQDIQSKILSGYPESPYIENVRFVSSVT